MRKDKGIRKVRRAYRQNMLAQICALDEEKFGAAFGMETVHCGPPGDYYHFRDNGSAVLAVAHLDTVVKRDQRRAHFYETDEGPAVMSGALDDRLGAYVILGVLPKLGITTDILLTVGEECGQSTASYFMPPRQYDWVIEFDRMGTDVVMYQYEDEPSCQAVEAAGAEVGFGSFSDIADLEHLGVKAFNWGVGYAGNYHSQHGYAYLNDTFDMVAKYARFHKQNAGMVMAHDPVTARWPAVETGARWPAVDACPMCNAREGVNYTTMICGECGYCADCMEHNLDCQCYTPASAGRLRREQVVTYCPDCGWPVDDCACLVQDNLPGEDYASGRPTPGTAHGGAPLAIARGADSGAITYAEAERRMALIGREAAKGPRGS